MPETVHPPSGTASKSKDRDRARESGIIERVEADLAHYRELGLLFERGEAHTEDWNQFYAWGNAKLFDASGRIDREVIRNFWRRHIYIGDNPRYGQARGLRLLLGQHRGEVAMLEEMKRVLRRHDCRELLRKYPCPQAGKPHLFKSGGYKLTHRWAKHIYHLKRMNEFLKERLAPGFVTLDIGSGHGLFSSLVHQEYPGSHCVLVELPEQLLLARYFLELTFPEARIGGVRELAGLERIGRETLEAYDFILLPWQFYERLEAGSVDLVSSFAALGELKRSTFEAYVNAPVFRSAKYLYTANPVQTDRMFDGSDLTLLDYPIQRGEGRLYFGVSPVFLYQYVRPRPRFTFFYELRRLTPFFEYIGGIEAE